MPKKKTASPKKQSPDKLFQVRWKEFTGRAFTKSLTAPGTLIGSVRTLAAIAAPAALALADPPVELWAHVRARRGVDCEQEAEVSAFYSGDITIVGVWGRANLLQILNAAAAQEGCKDAVKCAKRC